MRRLSRANLANHTIIVLRTSMRVIFDSLPISILSGFPKDHEHRTSRVPTLHPCKNAALAILHNPDMPLLLGQAEQPE
jgi:hypothetical protein